ncbi:neuroligin-1-like [Palaemon carinicauda]|uniref:neuroligin-1-like n=1 Tax=Palaemon carinicauda TaxID=392227 RepID=UPI0035B68BB6
MNKSLENFNQYTYLGQTNPIYEIRVPLLIPLLANAALEPHLLDPSTTPSYSCLLADAALMAYPVVVFLHGESFEWGSSSLYDGSVLAALGKVIVVTLNYRLGILGFYNANTDPLSRPTVANYGLMDQLAALHWVQENIVRFGGDPGQVTVIGHGTGAACLNYLVISPAATGTGLFKRAILMSGSALSSWASVRDPSGHAFDVATQQDCPVPNDLFRHYENLLQCLRKRPLHDILKVQLKTSKFQVAVGPSIDGVTIKLDWKNHQSKMGKEGRTPVDLLLGMTAANLLDILSQQEVQEGFDADYREDLLRSFVVNNSCYHQHEIMFAITAEYTDWSRSLHQPISIRDSTGQGLHDANIVSPMIDLAKQLYTTSRSSYLYVLEEEASDSGKESLLLKELAYFFGGPLGALGPLASSYNFTKMDVTLSKSFISMWSNFIKLGEGVVRLNVMLNGELLEDVVQSESLGSVIAANGGVEADVRQKVNEGCKVLGE